MDSEVGKWSEFTVDLPLLDSPVDVKDQSTRLRQAVVMLIDGPTATWVEDNDQLRAVLDHYEIAYRSFADIDNLQEAVSAMHHGDSQCICFIPEDIYSSGRFEQFRHNVPNFVSFISFGPKYKTTTGRSGHIRSMKQMLPSVVIDMLVRRAASNRRRCTMLESELDSAEDTQARNPQDDSYRLMKVLIAEDNKINQKVLIRMLKRLGLENVKIADNGKIACDMEAAEHFDICLMDMQMPVMDGLEACREILDRPKRQEEQGQKASHQVPAIVFVTAQVSTGFVTECEAAGSSDFLAKPFNVDEIEACLRKTWAETNSP